MRDHAYGGAATLVPGKHSEDLAVIVRSLRLKTKVRGTLGAQRERPVPRQWVSDPSRGTGAGAARVRPRLSPTSNGWSSAAAEGSPLQ